MDSETGDCTVCQWVIHSSRVIRAGRRSSVTITTPGERSPSGQSRGSPKRVAAVVGVHRLGDEVPGDAVARVAQHRLESARGRRSGRARSRPARRAAPRPPVVASGPAPGRRCRRPASRGRAGRGRGAPGRARHGRCARGRPGSAPARGQHRYCSFSIPRTLWHAPPRSSRLRTRPRRWGPPAEAGGEEVGGGSRRRRRGRGRARPGRRARHRRSGRR